MFDHVGLNVKDYAASRAFYEQALAPLGYGVVMGSDEWKGVGFGTDGKPSFWVGPLTTGEPGSKLEVHVAFAAPDRAAVRAFFDAAVATGAEVLHEPRLWPEYHPSYYGAFVRDPDGHNVEAVCHRPE